MIIGIIGALWLKLVKIGPPHPFLLNGQDDCFLMLPGQCRDGCENAEGCQKQDWGQRFCHSLILSDDLAFIRAEPKVTQVITLYIIVLLARIIVIPELDFRSFSFLKTIAG